MSKIARKTLVLLFFLTLFFAQAISLAAWTTKDNYPVDNITLKDLFYGSEQERFARWYKDEVPLKEEFAWAYNQMRYSLFNEASDGWIMGKEKYIFDEDQTLSYVTAQLANDDEAYDLYAKKIAYFQEEMKKVGKTFVYLLNPIKAQLYEEYLPDNYANVLKENEDKETEHDKLKAAFERNGVCYYDALDVLQSIKKDGRYPTYGINRHHWTNYAAAVTANSLFSFLTKVYLKQFPELKLEVISSEETLSDRELTALVRLKWYKKETTLYNVNVHYSSKMPGKLLILGTSFGGQFTDVLERDRQVFDEINWYSYLTKKSTSNNSGYNDVPYVDGELVNGSQLWDDVLKSDYIIMESQGMQGILHSRLLDYVIDKLQNGDKKDPAKMDGENWVIAENNHRWSTDNDCSLTFLQPVKGRDTYLTATLKSYDVQRKVNVFANGLYLTSIEVPADSFAPFEFVVPNDVVDEDRNIMLSFHIEGELYSPQEKEGSGALGDRRTYGIGISELDVRYPET